MAKTNGPLLSFGARGSFAKTATFATWRGVKYARQRVIPENPNTTAQQATRNVFRTMSELWKVSGTLLRAPWDAAASGRPKTDRNIFIGNNTKLLRGQTSLANWQASPGARGGLPPENVTVDTGTAGEITVTFTNPTPPTGWTLDSAVAAILEDQDPSDPLASTPMEAEDATSQSTVTFTGLTSGNAYAVAAWLEWTKPDGRKAFSVSETQLATVT